MSPETFNISSYKPTQTFNHSEVNTNKYSKYRTFGDHFGEKETGHIQIVSQNIYCLGIKSKNNSKQDRLINWLLQSEINIIGWQE